MKYALVNPRWSYEGSIYFGCREPHLPLEFGYSRALLEQQGHEVLLLDADLLHMEPATLRRRVAGFAPDITVIPTAPTYLFWRCPPPELRVPLDTVALLRDVGGVLVAVGPHASTTPRAVLEKLGVDALVMGECEQVLPRLADPDWSDIEGLAWHDGERTVFQGGPQAADLERLPILRWERELLAAHRHHHHRFDQTPMGLGAELEASRGCPYACTFCAKDNYRDRYRRRPVATILEELDDLIAKGVSYAYFVDEIFLPNRDLLQGLQERPIQFGIQTRIDLWKQDLLDQLGEAGCISIEVGVESVSELGRFLFNKSCMLSAQELQARLIQAKRNVPFVRAHLLDSQMDDDEAVEKWRQELLEHGVLAEKPAPIFPYPGSPSYTQLWGPPDDHAWERAHEHYLRQRLIASGIPDGCPPLSSLEKPQGPLS